MAKKNIKQNAKQAIDDLKGIKSAIINRGVAIPNGTPTRQYAGKISEISGVYSGEFTPTTDTQTYTLENLPFQPKKIYIWSTDVAGSTVEGSTNKYCMDLNIDTTLKEGLFKTLAIFKYWQTNVTPNKSGYTRTAIGGYAFANITKNSISIDLNQLGDNQNFAFKSGCTYRYTITEDEDEDEDEEKNGSTK